MHYQLIEFGNVHPDIMCPFCRQTVVHQHLVMAEQLCSHVLFVAMDLGFEFVSHSFEASLPLSIDDLHAQDNPDIWGSLLQSNLTDVQLIKSPLGVANLYHYLGFLQN